MKQAYYARNAIIQIIISFVFGLIVTLLVSSFSYRKNIQHVSICPRATVGLLDCTTGQKVIDVEHKVQAGWPLPIWSRTLDSTSDLRFSWPFCTQGCVLNSAGSVITDINWPYLVIDLGIWLLVSTSAILALSYSKRSKIVR